MASYLTETGLTKLVTKVKGLFASHTNNKDNPHKVTKTQLGLDNTENKSSQMIRDEITFENVISSLGFTPQPNVANTADVDGFVTKGKNYPNKVWKTDEKGNPAWREDTTVEVDTSLSIESSNPVENQVITAEFNNKVPTTRTINEKTLSNDIVLTSEDIGADIAGSAQTAYDNAVIYIDDKEQITTSEPTNQKIGNYWLLEY